MSRCDECMQWTKEEMESYMKLRRSLSSKSKRNKSSPPRSTPHDSDIDHSFVVQLESVNKSVDNKIEAMSLSLLSQFSSMLEKFQPRANTTFFQIPLRCRGIQLACLSLRPVVQPSAPRAKLALGSEGR